MWNLGEDLEPSTEFDVIQRNLLQRMQRLDVRDAPFLSCATVWRMKRP